MGSSSPKLNVLVAYPYATKQVLEYLSGMQNTRFLLDSGAFTAWRAGKRIELDDYCRFLETIPVKPWRYFNLDVVGNGEASFKNYQIMRQRGFSPVPVFTRGDPVERIDAYYETSDVVGLGGLGGMKKKRGYVKGFMEEAMGRRVHWLGFVQHDFINHYRPYMCDASSWSHASRNGDLKVYLGEGKIVSLRRAQALSRPKERLVRALLSYGLLAAVKTKAFWKDHRQLNSAAARMWVRRSIDAERVLGTHLFLAAASSWDLSMLFAGFRKEIGK